MNPSIREDYQRTLMCYLDEKYADSGVSKELQVVSLTGVYLPADRVVEFRRRLYSCSRISFSMTRRTHEYQALFLVMPASYLRMPKSLMARGSRTRIDWSS